MSYITYDKDAIKNNLDIESVASLVSHFGGEPVLRGDYFVARTVCHNELGEGSHKLYYYENTALFKCYTFCDEPMDIFELVIKIKRLEEDTDWTLPQAISYVANFFGIAGEIEKSIENKEDWQVFQKYDKISNLDLNSKTAELKTYDKDILKFYPKPRILPWLKDGISQETMQNKGICYNPITGGILIPHYDINNNLVGIRERTLLVENEKRFKYIPSTLGGFQYSHPLGFNLYGLNDSKYNIKEMQTALIVEAEKSVMLYDTFFGQENSIACATCGSNLINFQAQLLFNLEVKELIIAFDKDWEKTGDENYHKVIKKLKNIHQKYGSYVQVSFLFDKEDLLGYKDSPLDKGKEIFEHLYANRIIL